MRREGAGWLGLIGVAMGIAVTLGTWGVVLLAQTGGYPNGKSSQGTVISVSRAGGKCSPLVSYRAGGTIWEIRGAGDGRLCDSLGKHFKVSWARTAPGSGRIQWFGYSWRGKLLIWGGTLFFVLGCVGIGFEIRKILAGRRSGGRESGDEGLLDI